MCLQPVLNVLVQLLVAACGFSGVKVTSANNIQVRSREVECLSDNVKISDGYELLNTVSN